MNGSPIPAKLLRHIELVRTTIRALQLAGRDAEAKLQQLEEELAQWHRDHGGNSGPERAS